MVNWPVTKSTMSLAKSIKQTTTGLSLTKTSCNPNHHHHLALNSSSSHATHPTITTTQHSSHKSHHLSQTQHVATHRSHGTHSTPSQYQHSSTPSSPQQMSINKHLFSAKPKDSIFDQEDVNRICQHVKFNKMDIKNHENVKQNHEKQGALLSMDHEINDDSLNNNNQMITTKINTNSAENENENYEIDYKEKNNEQDEEYKQDKKEQDEDYINSQLIKRCPNAMNEIMTMTRSKSMHDIRNFNTFSDSTNNHEIEPILTTQRSWPFGSINQDNNYSNNNMDKFSCNNIVPGGISMNNINKFQKEQDDDINNNVEEYGNQNRIKIKHSPWEKNIDWNCVNITL